MNNRPSNILLVSVQKTLDVMGLKYIHYSLLQHSFNSTLVFLTKSELNSNELETFREFVRNLSPKLIGFSLMAIDVDRVAIVTNFLKKYFPEIPIIWGGYHPTVVPEECLEYADYVFLGEGEEAIVEIARAIEQNKSIKDIKGVCFKEGNKIYKNPIYSLTDISSIYLLDHIPKNSFILNNGKIDFLSKRLFSKYDRFSGKMFLITSSRGCPFSCTFCCNSFFTKLYNSKKVRRRNVSNIISEIEKALNDHPEIEYIDFLDDCFLGASNEYIDEFCSMYKLRINKPFKAGVTPKTVSPERILSLKEAGMTWVGLGLQSGSDRTNKIIYNRNSLAGDFLKAAKICSDYKIALYYDVIVDNPYETEEDRLQTIQTVMEAPNPCLLQMCSLTFYPGSLLYERVKEKMPEKIKNSNLSLRDHAQYEKNACNDMTRMAAYLPPYLTAKTISLYKKDKKSLKFIITLKICKFISAYFFEILNYILAIKLSQRGSYRKTMKVLPSYLKVGLRIYFTQFENIGGRFNYVTKKT